MNKIRNTEGFTLIELLVVVAIIGILAAIAIPQFAIYRQKGYDSQAVADLHNAATAEEAYWIANQAYATCTSGADCQSKLPGYWYTKNVTVALTAAGSKFTGTASQPSGSGKTFSWDSSNGGLQ